MQELEKLIEAIASSLKSYPLAWAFVLSALSNSIPYVGVPYLIAIAVYGATLDDPLMKLGIVLSSGAGAAAGKLVIYSVCRGVRTVLPSEVKENLWLFTKLFRKSMFVAIYLFAALPLPDDVLYVPVGVAGYNAVLFFLAVLLGKITITALALLLGTVVGFLLEEGAGADPLKAAATVAALSIVLTVVIARMNWRAVLEAYERGGVLAMLQSMVHEALKALLPRRRRVQPLRPQSR